MTGSIWIAALFACFVWWFSTGLILLVVRRADRAGGRAHGAAALSAIPVATLGALGVAAADGQGSVAAAYLGFASALAIWGAIELTFLTGAITGPSRARCGHDLRPADRLWSAWNTICYHELLLAVGLLAVVVLSSGDPASVASATYLVLFTARILAKANLFFGVPRINIEFIPQPLAHLTTYFRQGPVTPAFPISITLLSLTLACFIFHIATATTAGAAAGFALLAAITGLALLEHWLMVLPLPDAALWRWMLPAPGTAPHDAIPQGPLKPGER